MSHHDLFMAENAFSQAKSASASSRHREAHQHLVSAYRRLKHWHNEHGHDTFAMLASVKEREHRKEAEQDKPAKVDYRKELMESEKLMEDIGKQHTRLYHEKKFKQFGELAKKATAKAQQAKYSMISAYHKRMLDKFNDKSYVAEYRYPAPNDYYLSENMMDLAESHIKLANEAAKNGTLGTMLEHVAIASAFAGYHHENIGDHVLAEQAFAIESNATDRLATEANLFEGVEALPEWVLELHRRYMDHVKRLIHQKKFKKMLSESLGDMIGNDQKIMKWHHDRGTVHRKLADAARAKGDMYGYHEHSAMGHYATVHSWNALARLHKNDPEKVAGFKREADMHDEAAKHHLKKATEVLRREVGDRKLFEGNEPAAYRCPYCERVQERDVSELKGCCGESAHRLEPLTKEELEQHKKVMEEGVGNPIPKKLASKIAFLEREPLASGYDAKGNSIRQWEIGTKKGWAFDDGSHGTLGTKAEVLDRAKYLQPCDCDRCTSPD